MSQSFTVSHDTTLLEFLYEAFSDASRTGVKDMLSNGRIMVDGVRTRAFNQPLTKGSRVEVLSKAASIGFSMKENASEKVKKQGIDILYEDAHLIVVFKEAGIASGAAKGLGSKTGPNACGILNEYMRTSKKAGIKAGTGDWKAASRTYLVNRLDRNASGLMLFAKDEHTRDLILSKWDSMVLEYRFSALLEGNIKENSGRITSWIGEDSKTGRLFSGTEESDGGQKAVSAWKVLARGRKNTLVEFSPETLRPQQLRIHASIDLGHPVVGDERYGSTLAFRGRLALHCGDLAFRNPYTNEIQRFHIPTPETMLKDSRRNDKNL